MGENGNPHSQVTLYHPVSDLEQVLREVHRIGFTGSITVHYSQGAVSGMMEIKQKISAGFFDIRDWIINRYTHPPK